MADRTDSGPLLPCPFCGGAAKVGSVRDGRRVFCNSCFAGGPPQYHGPDSKPPAEQRAIDSWNDREAVAPAVRELAMHLISLRTRSSIAMVLEEYEMDAIDHTLDRYRHLLDSTD